MMGEIRVKVRLKNMYDELRRLRGELSADEIRTYEAEAMVDTGAVRCVVPKQIVERIGVEIRGHRIAEYADGRTETVGMTEAIIFDLLGRDTADEALVLGDEILIGQTVLEKLDLLADRAGQRVIPNPAHPDGPISKVK
jgi:clan AA aspartic protease